MDAYALAKTLHILSSTVLFGTGMGTAFQMVWVMRHGNAAQVAQTAAGVVMADWIFTTPAGVIQPLSGLWLIHLTGFSLTEPWLIAAYALYLLAFLCWAPSSICNCASATSAARRRRMRRSRLRQSASTASGSPWAGPPSWRLW